MLLLGGCVTQSAGDLATPSEAQADVKRGREEQLARFQRDYERHSAACVRGDPRACTRMQRDYREIQHLRALLPAEAAGQ